MEFCLAFKILIWSTWDFQGVAVLFLNNIRSIKCADILSSADMLCTALTYTRAAGSKLVQEDIASERLPDLVWQVSRRHELRDMRSILARITFGMPSKIEVVKSPLSGEAD